MCKEAQFGWLMMRVVAAGLALPVSTASAQAIDLSSPHSEPPAALSANEPGVPSMQLADRSTFSDLNVLRPTVPVPSTGSNKNSPSAYPPTNPASPPSPSVATSAVDSAA